MNLSNCDSVPRVRGASISFRAAQVIREAIFAGKIQPGDALQESLLTQDLGVSQTTVREALLSLEREGLVVRVPNKRTRVRKIATEELRERVAVYALLERAAVVEAAGKMSPGDLEQLERCGKQVDQALRRGAFHSFQWPDLEFHRCLWRCSGNMVLYTTLDSLAVPMFALARRISDPVGRANAAAGHQAVIRALKSRDKRQISQAVSEHAAMCFLDEDLSSFNFLD